jgi:hypothetical protein
LQVLGNIEAAQRHNRLFAVLEEGNEALKSLQKLVTLDDVEQLMSESAAAKEYEGQIQQALRDNLSSEEDAAALDEFNQLEKEILKDEISEWPAAPEVAEVSMHCPYLVPTAFKLTSLCGYPYSPWTGSL